MKKSIRLLLALAAGVAVNTAGNVQGYQMGAYDHVVRWPWDDCPAGYRPNPPFGYFECYKPRNTTWEELDNRLQNLRR